MPVIINKVAKPGEIRTVTIEPHKVVIYLYDKQIITYERKPK